MRNLRSKKSYVSLYENDPAVTKMHKLIYFKIIIAIFLMAALFTGEPGPGEGSAAHMAKIHYDLQERLDAGDDYIEAFLILTERADTGKVAGVVRQQTRPLATAGQVKTLTRRAVVNTLKDKAEKTQEPILDFLNREKDRGGVREIKNYFIINVIYLKAEPAVIKTLARSPDIEEIVPNKTFEILQETDTGSINLQDGVSPAGTGSTGEWDNIERIKAPQVWDQYGIDGEGIVIGIMDTGVNWEHEAIKEKWRGYCPEGNHEPEYSWYDAAYGQEMPYDTRNNNHGTHVTGIAVGADPEENNIIGVAPGARWIAANAFLINGGAPFDNLLDAGEYLLAPGGNPDMAPDIINNSWGSAVTGDQENDEWFRQMVQSWRHAGIFTVAAAGNYGDLGIAGILPPAKYPESVAVAFLDHEDVRAEKSCYGPTRYYPGELKPNISAPGVSILSSTSGTSEYGLITGSSMASPHVAGAAALLLAYNPAMTVEELEDTLYAAATPLTDNDFPESPNYGYGHGLINVLAAMESISLSLIKIEVSSQPSEGGSVSGGGNYDHGEEVTVWAWVEEGYAFTGWYDGDEKVSADMEYTFVVTSPRVLTARFSINYPPGDVGGTGEVEISDAILVLRHVVGLIDLTNAEEYSEGAFERARVSGGENPRIIDAILIMSYIVGLIPNL